MTAIPTNGPPSFSSAIVETRSGAIAALIAQIRAQQLDALLIAHCKDVVGTAEFRNGAVSSARAGVVEDMAHAIATMEGWSEGQYAVFRRASRGRGTLSIMIVADDSTNATRWLDALKRQGVDAQAVVWPDHRLEVVGFVRPHLMFVDCGADGRAGRCADTRALLRRACGGSPPVTISIVTPPHDCDNGLMLCIDATNFDADSARVIEHWRSRLRRRLTTLSISGERPVANGGPPRLGSTEDAESMRGSVSGIAEQAPPSDGKQKWIALSILVVGSALLWALVGLMLR